MVQKQPNPEFVERWSFGYEGDMAGTDVRVDTVKELVIADLARADDLKAPVEIMAAA